MDHINKGSVPEMRIWSILLIKSDLKWCIHIISSLFLYINKKSTAILHYICECMIVSHSFVSMGDFKVPTVPGNSVKWEARSNSTYVQHKTASFNRVNNITFGITCCNRICAKKSLTFEFNVIFVAMFLWSFVRYTEHFVQMSPYHLATKSIQSSSLSF